MLAPILPTPATEFGVSPHRDRVNLGAETGETRFKRVERKGVKSGVVEPRSRRVRFAFGGNAVRREVEPGCGSESGTS